MRPLNILTWSFDGNYLCNLAHLRHHFYLPVKPEGAEGYAGRCGNTHWPANLHEVPAEDVKDLQLDCVLFQSRRNFTDDQYEILSPAQQRLPRIYLEHEPPRQHPTDARHPVDDPDVLLIHVNAFNQLMWDNGRTPTRVIEHGVSISPEVLYRGELARGIAAVNGMGLHGRWLGADLFDRARRVVPLDLVGLHSQEWGGLGEVAHHQLPAYESHYRFFFHPVRYASLSMAVCEAMMIGMPVVAIATAEMAATITNGVSGYIDTDLDRLIGHMQRLLDNRREARRLGEEARRHALRRFSIHRFIRDWDEAFALVTGRKPIRVFGAEIEASCRVEGLSAAAMCKPNGKTVGEVS